jgi:hypothetical protein
VGLSAVTVAVKVIACPARPPSALSETLTVDPVGEAPADGVSAGIASSATESNISPAQLPTVNPDRRFDIKGPKRCELRAACPFDRDRGLQT